MHKTLAIESCHSAICDLCSALVDELKARQFSADEIFAIHLAVEEALINALKHGNKADSSKTITIDYSISAGGFEIRISDEGTGFSPGAVPDPREEANLLKTSGRGLLLMRAYMDSVEYGKEGNVVFMTKHRNPVK